MMKFFARIDKTFLIVTGLLIFVGFLIFSSASMGLLARNGASFSTVAIKQIVIGLIGGGISAFIISHIPYTYYKKYAFHFFAATLVLTSLVFIPALGFSHGGATRWLSIAGISFQPSEILKLGFIIYLAAWLSKNHKKNHLFKEGLVPVGIIFAVVSVPLLLQPDNDTLAVILFTGTIMYFVAGASLRHIGMIIVAGMIGLSMLVVVHPYVKSRIMTFINPAGDTQNSGYQINQSLIAIGSGGFWGRGFGQSVQKFNYLPEPIGDSIFAVVAEEFGFVGSVALLLLFMFFGLRGLYIASNTKDTFGGLVVLGIITLIITQSIINVSAMMGIIPLSGIPLVFISHGGTALLIALAEIGIILNISTTLSTKRNLKNSVK